MHPRIIPRRKYLVPSMAPDEFRASYHDRCGNLVWQWFPTREAARMWLAQNAGQAKYLAPSRPRKWLIVGVSRSKPKSRFDIIPPMNTKTADEKISDALEWARFAAEEERGRVDRAGDGAMVPSWLPELEAALKAVDEHEPSELEIAMEEAADELRPGPRY
jgi:hypothetical protein